MKKYYYLPLMFLFVIQATNAQSKKELKQQHDRMLDTLGKKLSGVKYADLRLSKSEETALLSNTSSADMAVIVGFRNYFKELGIEVILTDEQRTQALKLAKSQCDYVMFAYEIGEFNSKLMAIGNYPFTYAFKFCDNSTYSFSTKLRVNGLTNYSYSVKTICMSNFFYKRKYSIDERLAIQQNENAISKADFKTYLDTAQDKKSIEGIFQLLSSESNISNYSIGIYSKNDSLKVVYFDGADYSDDWKEGELKGYLTSTLSENDFIVKWVSLEKKLIDGSISFTNKNSFDLKINTIGYSKGTDKFVRVK